MTVTVKKAGSFCVHQSDTEKTQAHAYIYIYTHIHIYTYEREKKNWDMRGRTRRSKITQMCKSCEVPEFTIEHECPSIRVKGNWTNCSIEARKYTHNEGESKERKRKKKKPRKKWSHPLDSWQ